MLETYRIIDRVNKISGKPWADGPWANEPDQIQWRDERSGLRCLMRRTGMGSWCGYVGVPPQHILHNKYYMPEKGKRIDGKIVMTPVEYDEAIDSLNAHGGITYCGTDLDIHDNVSDQPDEYYWWIGFDCAHSFDFMPGMPIIHAGATYRDVNFVREEVTSLAKQIYELNEEVRTNAISRE